MKRCMNGLISVTDCCSGAFNAIVMLPTMHKKQPIQPKNVKVSCGAFPRSAGVTFCGARRLRGNTLRKMWLSMAHITTLSAPRGVTRTAAVKLRGAICVSLWLESRDVLLKRTCKRPGCRSDADREASQIQESSALG